MNTYPKAVVDVSMLGPSRFHARFLTQPKCKIPLKSLASSTIKPQKSPTRFHEDPLMQRKANRASDSNPLGTLSSPIPEQKLLSLSGLPAGPVQIRRTTTFVPLQEWEGYVIEIA